MRAYVAAMLAMISPTLILIPTLAHSGFSPTLAHAGFSIVTFNLPGGKPTCGRAISRDGAVLGTSGVSVNPGISFIYAKGHFARPKPVLPTGTIFYGGINVHHELAGGDLIFNAQETAASEAFTYMGGRTNTFSLSNAISAAATGLNDAGTLVGYYQTSTDGPTYGFVRQSNTLLTLDAGAGSTIPEAINEPGTAVAGVLLGADGSITSWLYQNGTYTPIAYPHAALTTVAGIYGSGWVTGSYFTGTAPNLIAHGFRYHAGAFAAFDVRGAQQTQVTGANALGQFTGCFIDAKGTHGFVATPK